MGKLSIKHVMWGTVATVAAAVITVMLMTWSNVNALRAGIDQNNRELEGRRILLELRYHIVQIQQFVTDVAATHDREVLQEARVHLNSALGKLSEYAKLHPEDEKFVAQSKQAVQDVFDAGTRMADVYITQGVEAGNALMKGAGGLDDVSARLARSMEDEIKASSEHAKKATASLDGVKDATVRNVVLLNLLLLGLVMGAFVILSRRILKPLTHVRGALVSLNSGSGDLRQRLPKETDDEVGEIVDQVNAFMGRYHQLVQQLNDFHKELAGATQQISHLSDQTRNELSEQQSETAQVATAINQMSATVQEVANSAAGTAAATQQAHEESAQGRTVVLTTMEAINNLADEVKRAAAVMGRLEKDSEAIGTVLDVIRDIADQTNLLALNAAIEAARAGEQGRGFAVVADEVRTLASRTQQSTQEIQQMIERLQGAAREAASVMGQGTQRAENSVQQAARAGESLDTIAQAVSTINDMSSQIASAAEEQSAAADEITRNVDSIRTRAESTAQGAEQASAITEKLVALNAQLHGLIGQYRI